MCSRTSKRWQRWSTTWRPTGPLFVSCAGAAQLAKTNVLSFVNAVVTGAAGFAAMPVIPGL